MSFIKEVLIVSNNINESEYLKSLSLQGKNTIGLRVVKTKELCDYYLMKNGIEFSEHLIDSNEQINIISKLSSLNAKYFNNSTLEDIKYIAKSINELRMAFTTDECRNNDALYDFIDNHFSNDKKEALNNLIKEYLNYLENNNLMDCPLYIKKTIESINQGKDNNVKCSGGFSVLENELIEKINNGDKCDNIHLKKYGDIAAEALKINYFSKSYGITNEIDTCINKIYNTKSIDSCMIVAPNSYNDYLYERLTLLSIPATFGMGIPLRLSNPGKLLGILINMKKHSFGVNEYRMLFDSSVFDVKKLFTKLEIPENVGIKELTKLLGWLKINIGINSDVNYKKINEFKLVKHFSYYEKLVKDYVIKIAEELSNDIEDILNTYCVIRESKNHLLDKSALDEVINAVKVFKNNERIDIYSIFSDLLNRSICQSTWKEGMLHICNIESAFGCVRDNVYIIGMGANVYPEKCSENYLVFDSEYNCISNSNYLPTKDNNIKYKKDVANSLIAYLNSYNSNISVSFSYYDTKDLSECNPSSIFYDLYNKNGYDLDTIKKENDKHQKLDFYGYFNNSTEEYELTLKDAISGKYKLVNDDLLLSGNSSTIDYLGMSISSTTFEKFIKCPLRFYYENILGMSSDNDNVYDVIPSNCEGDIVHSIIEGLLENKWTREEYEKQIEEEVIDFFRKRPNISDSVDERKHYIDRIKRNLARAYDKFIGLQLYAIEKKYEADIEFDCDGKNVKLHFEGKPDIIVKDGDKLVVIDLKNKNSIEHSKIFEECCQTMLYAKLIEEIDKPYIVDHTEYYYTKLDTTVNCVYSNDMKNKMEEYFVKLYNALKNNEYIDTIAEKLREYDNYEDMKKKNHGIAGKLDKLCEYCVNINHCKTRKEIGK